MVSERCSYVTSPRGDDVSPLKYHQHVTICQNVVKIYQHAVKTIITMFVKSPLGYD